MCVGELDNKLAEWQGKRVVDVYPDDKLIEQPNDGTTSDKLK